MTPENFCYWLQGLLEVGQPDTLKQEQIKIIQDHLPLAFTKLTPNKNDNLDRLKLSDIFRENKTLTPYRPNGLYYTPVDLLIKKGPTNLELTC